MPRAALIIEDEVTLAKNMRAYLERNGYDVQVAASAEEGLEAFDEFKPDAVLLDYRLPGMDGLAALKELRRRDAHAKVIMLTGHGSVSIAVRAMKSGAFDFLTKPVVLGKLKLLLDKAIGEERAAQQLFYFNQRESQAGGLAKLLGNSEAMRALRATIAQALDAERALGAHAPPAVLITGETGTGKELVARALHFDGLRRAQPFIELNCASIPQQLLESELFGHERGAFTGARERKVGLVEAADGGTLFLDEVGEMDLPLQAKLLRLLEEKTIRRVGSVRDQKVDIRVIAATNRDLEKKIGDGSFRSDLFFRLRVVHLRLPALRERDADVLQLAERFLDEHARRYGKQGLAFTSDALAMLRNHRWPGNVRELRNVIEQAVLLCAGGEIRPDHLQLCSALAMPVAERRDSDECRSCPEAPCEGMKLDEVERELLLKALQQTGWNVSKAARLLGVSRDTLRYRMDKFRLQRGG